VVIQTKQNSTSCQSCLSLNEFKEELKIAKDTTDKSVREKFVQ
jgi:hypothetical protein